MAKITLTDQTNVVGAETTFLGETTGNNALIEAAIENTLSLDGTSPNSMNADLDINNQDILNANVVNALDVKVSGVSISALNVNWTGDWVTSTAYLLNDLVENNGTSFICILAHTSGAVDEPGVGASEATNWDHVADKGDAGLLWRNAWLTATVYALNDGVKNSSASFICILAHTSDAAKEPEVGGSWTTYWEHLAEQGATGGGTGDLLAANNLSDVGSDITSRSNLGVAIGTDVQAFGTILDDFNTLTPAATDGEFIVATAAGVFAYETGATARTSLGLGTFAVEALGQETIWIPAGAMETRATTAPAASNVVEIGTSLIALRTMDFATAADDFCGFAVLMPKSWDESTVIAQFVWSTDGSQTAGLDGVAWFIRAGAYASNDVLTTALGTAVAATAQNHSATADDVMITAETGAITVAGSPGAEEWVYFEVQRDIDDVGDDLDINARLHGVKIHYTVDAGSDT